MAKRKSKREINRQRAQQKMSLETHLHIIDSFCMRPIGAKISKNNCENCMFWENAHCTIAPEEMEIIEEYRKKREQAFTKSVKCIFEEL